MASENPKDIAAQHRIDLSLISPASAAHEAAALMDGKDKYGAYNIRSKKIEAMSYVSAARRHLDRYVDGMDYDPVSLCHELGHAKASIGLILDAMENDCLIDNRPPKGNANAMLERLSNNVEKRRELASKKPQEDEPFDWTSYKNGDIPRKR